MAKAGTLKVGSTIVFGDGERIVTVTEIDLERKIVKVFVEGPDHIRFGRESELKQRRKKKELIEKS